MSEHEAPVMCPACGHKIHEKECAQALGPLRSALSGRMLCCCTYWDARWETARD